MKRQPAAPPGPGRAAEPSSRRRRNPLSRLTSVQGFTPIRPALLPVVRPQMFLVRYLLPLQKRALKVGKVHFMRFVVMRELPHAGGKEMSQRLNYPYVFFESYFDGELGHYLDAFAYVFPVVLIQAWGAGFDFPKPPPSEPMKAWVTRNMLRGAHTYSAYPEATVQMVRASLNVRDRLRELLRTAPGLSPGAFKAAYEEFLTDLQGDL